MLTRPRRILRFALAALLGLSACRPPAPQTSGPAPTSAPASAPTLTGGEPARGEPPRPAPLPPNAPNILLIVLDDLAADAPGCAGNPHARTPHIDSLAASGTRFRHAAVMTPVCSPSRATILTGRSTHQHDVRRNSATLSGADTVARRLQVAGYETALIGKYHLGNDPQARSGFDRWVSFLPVADGGNGDTYRDPVFRVDGGVQRRRGYSTDALVDYASEWIARPRSGPFFAVVAFKNVHTPFDTPERFSRLNLDHEIPVPDSFNDPVDGLPPWVRGTARSGPVIRAPYLRDSFQKLSDELPADSPRTPLQEFIRRYWGNLAAADEALGRILAALRTAGVFDSTLIVFTSDNGFALGQRGLLGKHVAYEPALRVPLILRPPGGGPAQVRDELSLNLDIAPTLLDYAGQSAADLPGRSLKPLLEARPAEWRSDWLIMGQSLHTADGLRPAFLGVRGTRWKYVRYTVREVAEELFDLAADPDERRNVAAEPAVAEVLAGQRRRLQELMEADRLPAAWLEAFEPAARAERDGEGDD